MKKFFKYFIVALFVLPFIWGVASYFFMSDAEKAAMDIDSISEEMNEVETINELNNYIVEVDSIVKNFPELEGYADSLVYSNKTQALERIEEKQKRLDAAGAFLAAQEAVKQSLKSPSTAEFSSYHDDASASWEEDGVYITQFYVDAQNGFGATIRTKFQVKLVQSGENFKVIDVVDY